MAFVKAKIEIVSALVGTGIKISLRRGKKAKAKMMVGLTVAVAKQLDWAHGDKVEVLIGDGEHHGLIRLRKNNSAGEATVEKRETAKGAWFSINLSHQPAFVDRSEPALWCQWEKVEGWVEIVMPKWADETAPRRAAPVAAAPASAPAKPAPQPVRKTVSSVTASMMGDPPPGRREMLQKISELAK